MGEAFGAAVTSTKGRVAGVLAGPPPQEVNKVTMIISPRRGFEVFDMNGFKYLCADHGTGVGDVVTVGVNDGSVGYGDKVMVTVEEGVPVGCTGVGVLLGAWVWLAVGVRVPKTLLMITLGVGGILGTQRLSPAVK